MMHTAARHVRYASLAEAVSYLLLLGIAMPLKYAAGIPEAVKYSGWLHGVLFIVLVALLLRARITSALTTVQTAAIFLASLVPLLPFFLDARVKHWGQSTS